MIRRTGPDPPQRPWPKRLLVGCGLGQGGSGFYLRDPVVAERTPRRKPRGGQGRGREPGKERKRPRGTFSFSFWVWVCQTPIEVVAGGAPLRQPNCNFIGTRTDIAKDFKGLGLRTTIGFSTPHHLGRSPRPYAWPLSACRPVCCPSRIFWERNVTWWESPSYP